MLGVGVGSGVGSGVVESVGDGVALGLGVGFGVGLGVGVGSAHRGAGPAGPEATFVGVGAMYLSSGVTPGWVNMAAPRAAIALRSGSWIEPRGSKTALGWTIG